MTVQKKTTNHFLIIAGAWLLYKAVTLSSFWALLIPALTVLFIVEKYSWAGGLISFLIFLLFELSCFTLGFQPLDQGLIYSGAMLILSAGLIALKRLLFPVYPVNETGGDSETDSDAAPPPPLTKENCTVPPWPSSHSLLSHAEATDLDSRRLQSNIDASCRYFLELVRRALDCATVVLLRGDKEKGLVIHSFASGREDDIVRDLSGGSGVLTTILQDRDEIIVFPVSQQRRNIPYYLSNRGTGSLMAVKVDSRMIGEGQQFILCLDRQSADPWESGQKDFIRKAARKLGMELDIGLHISRAAHNTDTISRVCTHLQKMNRVLDLDSTFRVAIQSVRELVDFDFVAVSLIKGKEHVVVRAEGDHAKELTGKKFPVTEGLVGQAIKCKYWMPPNATYRGPAPIFSKKIPFSGFKSLFINPLGKRGGDVMGTLTLCSYKEGVYRKEEREVLELICRHVATKIELAQAHEKIYHLALTDGLTGLKNHRTFQRGFDKMLQRARRQKRPLCLVLCDIDHFKSINDTYGHPFGDEVLKAVADTLRRAVREVDLVARYGGEEFAMVLEDSAEDGALTQAERVRKAISSLKFRVQGDAIGVTMSFGISVFPDDGKVKEILTDKADQSLYHAKKSGRNRVVPYSVVREKEFKSLQSY